MQIHQLKGLSTLLIRKVTTENIFKIFSLKKKRLLNTEQVIAFLPNIVKVWKMPSIPHPYFIFIVFKAGLFFDFFPVGEVILKGLQAHPMGTTDNGLLPTSEQKVNLHLKNLRKIVIRDTSAYYY